MELIDSHTHLYCDDFLTEEQPKHPKKGVILPPPSLLHAAARRLWRGRYRQGSAI